MYASLVHIIVRNSSLKTAGNHSLLTYTRIDHVPLLDFSLGDRCMIRARHLDHPCRTHYRYRVLGQVPKNLLLFTEDWNLWRKTEKHTL